MEIKLFMVVAKNNSGGSYALNFSAIDRDHAILQMGMELGDVRAINDRDWVVDRVEEVTQ